MTEQDKLALVVTAKAETENWAERTLSNVEKLSISLAKQKDPHWSNTSALTDKMLRLSTATRQTAASAGART